MGKTLDKALYPNFSDDYQRAVLALMLQDKSFAQKALFISRMSVNGKTPVIFTNNHVQYIFSIVVDSMDKYKALPTRGHIETVISESQFANESKLLVSFLDSLLNRQIEDRDYYEETFITYVKDALSLGSIHELKNNLDKMPPSEAVKQLARINMTLSEIDDEPDTELTLDSIVGYLNDPRKVVERIPTGIQDLDKELNGGLPKGGLHLALGDSNVGKTRFMIGVIGTAALTRGKKVLHLNLDGRNDEPLELYTSSLNDIDTNRIINRDLNSTDLKAISNTREQYGKNLLIKNFGDKTVFAEDLWDYCEQVRTRFPFDVLIIDYIGVCGTRIKTSDIRERNMITHRMFRNFAKKFEVSVVTATQATRDAQQRMIEAKNKDGGGRPLIRGTDIAEAYEIYRVAETCLTLNRTDDEKNRNMLRVHVAKQRQGRTGKTVGLYTRYESCVLNTGNYFDPDVNVDFEEADGDSAEAKGIKTIKAIENTKRGIEKVIAKIEVELSRRISETIDKKEASIDPAEKESLHATILGFKEKGRSDVEKIQSDLKSVYPNLTPALLAAVREQIKDLKETGGDKAKLTELMREEKLMSYALGEAKILNLLAA
nr:hypothetical protein BdHM001_35100 [Bdellovibrio sp. HM001]